jgi:Uma2 family endonuclease
VAYDVFDADELLYPCSDGKPMAESLEQGRAIRYLIAGLEEVFVDREGVLVAGDFFWYPVEDRPDIVVAPDVAVIENIAVDTFNSYRPWRYGGRLTLAVEVWSPSNRAAEMRAKLAFYDTHGVDEYWEFDPARGRLRVWERREGSLVEIVTVDSWRSTVCGCRLAVHGREVVVFDPDGTRWPTAPERALLRRNVEMAEARIVELEAELARLRGGER